uniref:DDE-1 domain-containing protein n=1 Tax=Branchiostoma floridae TaxID=7739 RepID=C3ZUL0_BRAFL|eukprot:XP_002587711.1 hypothetical protein BRAFLDRAFT_94614 [Branchiostoma floridae]
MTFNLPSDTTIDYTGKKDCKMKTTGAGKKRCTVVCTVTADGGKYPLSVIFRGKRKQGAGVLPPGCKFPVWVMPSAWNDEDGCMKLARDTSTSSPSAKTARRLLVWDSASSTYAVK